MQISHARPGGLAAIKIVLILKMSQFDQSISQKCPIFKNVSNVLLGDGGGIKLNWDIVPKGERIL